MSEKHALLTAREIHGPYMQLFTNLQGENGRECLEALKKFNRRENPFPTETETPPLSQGLLTVPAGLTFEERINRGHYDGRAGLISEPTFLVTKKQQGEWEWKLFCLSRTGSQHDIYRLMDKEGYEGGVIGHLLAFGEKYPKEQKKYPIIAPSLPVWHRSPSTGSESIFIPSLEYTNDGRELDLRHSNNPMDVCCRFLGVRRRSAA